METFVIEERKGPLLLWTLSRPERLNALGPSMASALRQRFDGLLKTLAHSQPPRLLGIMAAPNDKKVWIAGGDLKELAQRPQPAAGREYAASLTTLNADFQALPIPVCMAVDGTAIGGGLEFALAGDLRLGTPDASFDFRQMKIGLTTAFGGAQRLVHLMGLSRAMHWQLLCANVSAVDALAAGLLHEILPHRAALLARLESLAQYFSTLAYPAVAAQKKMLQLATQPQQNAELDLFASLWMNPAHAAFLKKFMEK